MSYEIFQKWVKFGDANTSVELGILPAHCYVRAPFIHIPTAFNNASPCVIRVGIESNEDAFGTDKSLLSGLDDSDFSAGVDVGYISTSRKVIATIEATGTAPTQGQALVIIPYLRVSSP